MIKVVRLHYHIVKFEERKTLFHTLLITTCTKHIIYREMCTNFTKHINIVKPQKPVSVVNHNCLVVAKFYKAFHLLFKAVTVVLNGFCCHHATHIGSARRVTNVCSTTTYKNYRFIACHLQTLHKAKCHKMTNMKAVGSRIKTNIKGCLTVVYHFSYFFFVCNLRYKSAGYKFFINTHFIFYSYQAIPLQNCINFQ